MPDWKRAYINYFNEVNDFWGSATISLFLTDLTGDDIPEIFCIGNNGISLFYLDKSNEVREILNMDSIYCTNYAYNMVAFMGGHTGVYWDIIYCFDDSIGEFVEIFDGYYLDSDDNGYPNVDEDGNLVLRYFISDTSCTEEEYNQSLNEALQNKTLTYLDMSSVGTSDTLPNAIMNY